MILKDFPDIRWLKQQIAQGFQGRRGWDGTPLAQPTWPTVILNATTRYTERADIRGPLSIFTNLSGESYATANKNRVKVNEQFYFISNRDELYSLEIDSQQPVETFNIHVGNDFTDQFYQSLVLPAGKLLENPTNPANHPVAFFNHLYPRHFLFNHLLEGIRLAYREAGPNSLLVEEQLARLMWYLLNKHQHLLEKIQQLPPLKQTTKAEIYQRLAVAVDYLHTYYNQSPALDELAAVACLSKFHFLRLFKIAFQLTPHQYLTHIRMEKARGLLKASSLPVQEIAVCLGYENASSFSRVFYQHLRVYPSAYRNGC